MLRPPWLLATLLAAPLAHAAAAASDPDAALQRALDALREGRRAAALSELQALTAREPNFRAAHRLYADLLAARTNRVIDIPLASASGELTLADLDDELQLRFAGEVAVPGPDEVPNAVLEVAARHRHIIVVDLKLARLYVLANEGGRLSLVRHHYAAIGRNGTRKTLEGDLRTPVGIYHVTEWIDGRRLPDLYGSGAFPVSYPNAWDRFKGRTGYGIWLHGVPSNTYTRPPRSSEGCVTMANDHLIALRQEVEVGQTPVVFSDELTWIPAERAAAERDAWRARIEDWRARWSAVDTEGYLAYYHPQFTTVGMDRARFAAHKRRVNQSKTFIDVQIEDLNLWRYPGADEPLVLAEFTQVYRSSNFNSRTQKQQFWRQLPSGEWKIFREVNR